MSAPAYAVRGLGASLGATPILHQIDLELRAGCWTAVVGPNGAGKSTLLRAIAGLLPCSGQVELLGRELHDWPRQQRARALSWLGQNQSAADDLTVHDVAMLGRLPPQSWLAPASPAHLAAGERAPRHTPAPFPLHILQWIRDSLIAPSYRSSAP
ncbi:ABC transporter ATP-binding protein, partial [Malikia spinosa]|uniref:ABC transporter ATP-binding protein n=1 Tax=Malikia spinosa TaxID=86180 RepID=UPI00301CB8F6